MSDPVPEKTPLVIVRKSPPGESPPGALPAGNASRTDPSAFAPTRSLTAGERISNALSRPFVLAPVVIACVALLGWSLLIRLPAQPILARARSTPGPVKPALTHEDINRLAERSAAAMAQLMTNVDQVPRIISTLEQRARDAGFVTELSTRTPMAPIPGIPELARHSVIIRLENNYDRSEPAFTRLLAWLRTTSTLGVKVDLAAISMQSLGDGLTGATVEFHLLSLSADAKTAPK